MANKHPTYLLFSTGQNDPQRAYRSFAVFSINIHAVPVTQDNGYFVQDWQFLPDGIILDPASNPAENLFQAADSGTWQGALNHQNNLLHIDGTTYVTLGFKPNGETASESRHIHLAPGIVHNGQLEIFNPGPGRQIHFTTFGKSMILDTLYGETDGDFRMLGNKKYE